MANHYGQISLDLLLVGLWPIESELVLWYINTMNMISLFLYSIDVIPTLSHVIGWVTVVLASLMVTITFLCSINSSSEEDFRTNFSKYAKPLIKYIVAGTIIFVVIPTKQTMVLIAASEMGERLVKSQQVQAILDPSLELLQTYIKKETENLKKSLEPKPTK